MKGLQAWPGWRSNVSWRVVLEIGMEIGRTRIRPHHRIVATARRHGNRFAGERAWSTIGVPSFFWLQAAWCGRSGSQLVACLRLVAVPVDAGWRRSIC